MGNSSAVASRPPTGGHCADLSRYLRPECRPDFVDLFVVRGAILQAVQQELPRFTGRVLDVGCGYMPYKPLLLSDRTRVTSYIGLDLQGNQYQRPDVEWDGLHMPFGDNSVDCVLCTEVLEHCPSPEVLLSEAYRVLTDGGFLLATVPFLWPLHDVPHDEYRYTPFALKRLLRAAGFEDIRMKSLGGWDASLAQMIGLWVRRRPMRRVFRALLSRAVVPVIQFLLSRDRPEHEFSESVMLTGTCVVATKERTKQRRVGAG